MRSGHRVSRRLGRDRVKVLRIARSRHQALPSTGRATVPQRVARVVSIEVVDNCLGGDRHEVDGAIAEVGQLFGVANRPFGGETVADVARIRGHHRITARQRRSHFRIADRASPNAVADAHQPAVPAGSWQPDFDLDVAVRRWRHRRLHAAEGREASKARACYPRRRAEADGRLESARGDRCLPRPPFRRPA